MPLTRSGRERKLGRMMTGGQCFVAAACYGEPSPRDGRDEWRMLRFPSYFLEILQTLRT
jgi:hypothetical protein